MSQVFEKYEIVRELLKDGRSFKNRLTDIPEDRSLTGGSFAGRARSIEQVFQDRSSYRFFQSESRVAFTDLKTLLRKNHEYYTKNWGDDRLVEQYVLVERIDGRTMNPRTIYKYHHGDETLAGIGNLPKNWTKNMLFLQREFANAPAIIFFIGKLAQAVDAFGTSGYKNLLLRAGATAHHAWLQSLSIGYQGTVFAGVLPKSLRSFTAIDGYRKCQLFAYAFGHSPSAIDRFERG
jgi:hypothetical protein